MWNDKELIMEFKTLQNQSTLLYLLQFHRCKRNQKPKKKTSISSYNLNDILSQNILH